MELNHYGPWVETRDGRWVNLHHCDLLEAVEGKDGTTWSVLAWNALQPQIEAYEIAQLDSEQDAKRFAEMLLREVVGSA